MAVTWGTITAADVESALNDGELNDYRQKVSQIEDPLPTVIADVVSEVRGYLLSRYTLADYTTGVPSDLRTATIDIIIYRLTKRVAIGTGDGDALRADAADRAEKRLREAAQGEFGAYGPTRGSGSWGSATKLVV
jgi:hypothetical protein